VVRSIRTVVVSKLIYKGLCSSASVKKVKKNRQNKAQNAYLCAICVRKIKN
jgi:hypothetical protein